MRVRVRAVGNTQIVRLDGDEATPICAGSFLGSDEASDKKGFFWLETPVTIKSEMRF